MTNRNIALYYIHNSCLLISPVHKTSKLLAHLSFHQFFSAQSPHIIIVTPV